MGAPYYRFFPADYDRDTKHLSLMQHGAYRLLIDLYMNLGPIGNDMERINRTLHATSREEQAAVEYVLVEFFVLNGGQWTHNRCDKEREHTEGRRHAAQSSAAVRWHAKNAPAEQTECERIADAEQTQCDGNANQNQNQNQNQKSQSLLSPAAPGEASVEQKKPAKTVPDCPYEQVVALYHECLPALPGVVKLSEARKSTIRARWRELSAENPGSDQGAILTLLRAFFGQVARSDFLMGRKTNFTADLFWLLKTENFLKVVEGKYVNKTPERVGGYL
jgi:uncharacterized protein YdaU (DUF1376 family)